jgi:hypothetical protein
VRPLTKNVLKTTIFSLFTGTAPPAGVPRGFSKTSVFGKSTLDLLEKLSFWTAFPKQFPKLRTFGTTEFWKLLITVNNGA